jgi:hypothetical protein
MLQLNTTYLLAFNAKIKACSKYDSEEMEGLQISIDTKFLNNMVWTDVCISSA